MLTQDNQSPLMKIKVVMCNNQADCSFLSAGYLESDKVFRSSREEQCHS